MDGRFNEIGNVMDNLKLNARRQLRTQFLHFGSDVVRHAHRIHARLPEDLDRDHILGRRVLPKERGPRTQLLRAIFDLRHVPYAHRRSAPCANYDFAELFRGSDAPQRAQP